MVSLDWQHSSNQAQHISFHFHSRGTWDTLRKESLLRSTGKYEGRREGEAWHQEDVWRGWTLNSVLHGSINSNDNICLLFLYLHPNQCSCLHGLHLSHTAPCIAPYYNHKEGGNKVSCNKLIQFWFHQKRLKTQGSLVRHYVARCTI